MILRAVRVAHFSAGHAYSETERYGHNFKLEAHFDLKNDSGNWQSEIEKPLKAVVDSLDHRYLNEAVPFFKTNPATPENIARYCYEELNQKIKLPSLRVFKVRIYEGDRAWADFFCPDSTANERDF